MGRDPGEVDPPGSEGGAAAVVEEVGKVKTSKVLGVGRILGAAG